MVDDVERQARAVVAACLGYRTRKLARAVTRVYNDRLRAFDLGIAELNLLAAVAAYGPVQAAALGRVMDLEKSTLSRNTGRLVQRGWLETVEHPDGRGGLLALTASGQEKLVEALPAWEDAQERAWTLVADAVRDVVASRPAPR